MDSETVDQSYGSLQAVVAWGRDTLGHDYYLLYRTSYDHDPYLTWFNVLSRSESGPCNKTVQELIKGIRQLGEQLQVDSWSDMVGNLQGVPEDDRRTGETPVSCDAVCMLNKGDRRQSIVTV